VVDGLKFSAINKQYSTINYNQPTTNFSVHLNLLSAFATNTTFEYVQIHQYILEQFFNVAAGAEE
jgi:hypothetical protein